MNVLTSNLLSKINKALKLKPLIYFSKDPERALGLETLLDNYYIASIEDHYILSQLRANQSFVLNKIEINKNKKSTLNLVNNYKVQEWIKSLVKNKDFYAQCFHFNKPVERSIKNLNGILLNNNSELNQKFEDKISQYKILKNNNVPIPKGIIIQTNLTNYQELKKTLGENLVIQLNKGHTGIGTTFITNNDEWNTFNLLHSGNIVKITQHINGESYTVNGCITKNQVIVSGLQFQITGLNELTSAKGSTVGNDWSYANYLDSSIKQIILKTVKNIGEIMKKDGYKGLFGIDLIIKENQIYILEINARQTANISMQNQLELSTNLTPLSLLHLAEFLDIKIPDIKDNEIYPLEGAQVFLRSKTDNFELKNQIKSGIYTLTNDKEPLKVNKENKLLIWDRDGYKVKNLKQNEFNLFIQNKGLIKNNFDEVARMQFNHKIIRSDKLSPWIIKAMKIIEEMLK